MNTMTPIPLPKSLRFTSDYAWPFEATVCAAWPDFRPAVRALCDAVQKSLGLYARMIDCDELFSHENARGAHVLLRYEAGLGEQAYRIESAQGGAALYASDAAGAAHAASALMQMIRIDAGRVTLPEFTLSDAPDKPWRGLMLDLARNYIPLHAILRTVDLCWLMRLNRLHLHFSDGGVYRLPSVLYPELCHPDAYTAQEMAFLSQYAAARGVMIVPEIETPGHASIFTSAYPEFFANADGHGNSAICAGKPRVFERLEEVFREVAALFQDSPYLHIGGDEVDPESWASCPDCAEYMRAQGIGDSRALYAHFIERLTKAVVKIGRTPIVWEGFPAAGSEDIPRETIVMAFESLYQDAPDLLRAGFRLINASWKPLYLVPQSKNCPSTNPEAVYRWHAHRFDHWFSKSHAHPDGITVEPTDRVLGAQVCMWESDDIHAAGPVREAVIALAERVWNLDRRMDFEAFWRNAAALMTRMGDMIGR